VTAIEYTPALLERGRERATAERLRVTLQEGDAENIPFPDASFDVVLSTIGAMSAPGQEHTAGELLQACRPGGQTGPATRTPDGFIGEVLRVRARYYPRLRA
jgi:ubiquinone/menaquinone biosynthesis C-methylase UbiE